ncbi:MAG: response regulator [Thermoproteota archaeon]|nr:response regulator [Thermoproteota archaeon]
MKVLLIDDNKDINEMVCLCLESQDITVKVADEGREGLRSIKENHFDVVLLDLAMPGFSGFDIFNALKEEDLLKSKNIVIFTASSVTDNDIQEMLLAGAKGVLKKPISIDDLIETVEKFRQERN